MDMAMDILATDMVDMDTMDIMARGLLMLSPAMDIMVMDMVMDMAMDMDTATMDIMARDQLMLSPDMDMVMDMAMDILATDMVDMDTMDIMERDQLMLNQDMDIMAMDMAMDTMDMDMAMDMDIMVRQEPECCYFLEFSTTEVDQNRSSQDKHTF